MNRKDFGLLLAALRQDLGWTQFHLAEVSELDISIISQIERGVKKFFEPEILFKLADALQLTTLERREFIFAASGLDESQLVRQPTPGVSTAAHDPKRILDRLIFVTQELMLPAYLYDVYGDIVAVNNIILSLYQIPQFVFENASNVPAGYNVTRLNFSRDMVGRFQVAENWEQYGINAMRTFRECSFRYRATPYFKYLMNVFRNQTEYPVFERFWKLVSSREDDKQANVDHFSYLHKELGYLKYVASSSITYTSFGEIFLIYYLPIDEHTYQVFDQLKSKAGKGVTRLAPWPEKPMP
ncbi:MAG: helix-turn-helix domain-containing protein [Anaerolineales bacterium]